MNSAAHDAEAIYMLLAHQNIEPFIDLNNRSKKNSATDSDIQISPAGIQICPKSSQKETKLTKKVLSQFGLYSFLNYSNSINL
ncbi:dipeptidyl peptidase 3 [Paenibacillus sp. T3-5-0-4]|nr:dipeptidyl peptidase 3 [Paenibacillus endoradicis]